MAKVGTSFIDITDLTETLPLTLMLETNRDQNVQIKNGDLYTPNFKEGEGLIITPSLFIGQTEIIPFPYENIRYQVGEKDSENNTELDFSYANKHGYSDISVDEKGRLIYKRNLEKDLTIEARIEGYKHKDKDDIVASSVIASNPKTILFLEQGSSLYNLIITSKEGREHFEESNREPILLKAILYKGTQEVTNVTYEWDIVTDTDTDSNEDNNYPSGPDFKVVGQNLEVQRSWVSTLEVFQCTAALNDGSNLKFEAQKIIRDFVDNFSATIVSDRARILNPENSEITLTNNIYHLGNLVTDTSRITSYSWFLFYKEQEEKLIQEGISNTLVINLNAEENIFPKEDFSILCVALIDGKEMVVAYTDIIYRETFYRPVVSPKTIFIPVNKNGSPTPETFSHNIKFQLVDDGNNILDYVGQTSFAPSLKSNDNSSFENISQTAGKWEFKIPFSLDLSNNNDLWVSNSNSKTYEFIYTYLNTEFTEEFEVVKNYAGQDGSPGFSGYTIDLSNGFHSFAGGEATAEAKQETSCQISAYFGDEAKTITKITLDNISNNNILYTSEANGILVYNNSLMLKSNKIQDNIVEIIFRTGPDTTEETGNINLTKFLEDIDSLNFKITILDENGIEKIFLKTFSYTINYNGKSYYLNLSENSIKYSEANNSYLPNFITVSALSRETTGIATPYMNGKIIYSFDNEVWIALGSAGSISGYKNLKNIYIRLYSGLATEISTSGIVPSSILIENEQYLLDTETIPILTSMEGYQFGGENLIKWSKDMPLELKKWTKQDSAGEQVLIENLGDFNCAKIYIPKREYDQVGSYNKLFTPKIQIQPEWLDQDLTLSGYIYLDKENSSTFSIDDILENQNQKFEIWLSAYVDYSSENTNYDETFKLAEILNSNYNSDQELNIPSRESKKWLKFSKTFKLSSLGDFTNYSYFLIDFCCFNVIGGEDIVKNSFISLKQLKLELGNISTSWSASPYDISLEDINGINLLDNIFQREINFNSANNYRYNLADETILQKGIYYSLSYKDISNKTGESASLYLVLEGEDDSPKEVLKAISLPSEDFSFLINSQDNLSQLSLYSYDPIEQTSAKELTCFIRCLKLEKGKYSTSWSLTDEQIDEMLDLQLINYSLLDENGNVINFASQTDFEEYMNEIGKIQENLEDTNDTVSVLNTSYNSISSTVNELAAGGDEYYLGKISKGTIQLGYETDDSTPFLILSSEQNNKSFSMQLTNTSLAFYQNEQLLAEMTGFNLNIPHLSSSRIKVGSIVIKETPSGVGILWEKKEE